MAFLSEWDDRARQKGSRDPLGFEVVWSHYGRKIIGNLRTATWSLENFSVALLGFYWANKLNPTTSRPKERSQKIKKTFLRYEQLAGYLRYIHKTDPNSEKKDRDKRILGSRGIQSRIEEGKITLGFEHQILQDQEISGLWGLYYSAMKDTRLVEDSDRSLTVEGKNIAKRIEKELGNYYTNKLQKLLKREGRIVKKEDLRKKQCEKFFNAIRNNKACGELLEKLMKGSNESNEDPQLAKVQIELWEVTQRCSKEEVGPFIKEIKKKTQNGELEKRLSDIESVERLLVAVNNLFYYSQCKDGVKLSEVAEKIRNKNYDYTNLPESDQLKESPYKEKLKPIQNDLVNNNVEQAITKILELNKCVMKDRKEGVPWIEVDKDKTGWLKVRRKPEKDYELLDPRRLQTQWDNKYFLDSYLAIARNGWV